jgi:hypothetical protein
MVTVSRCAGGRMRGEHPEQSRAHPVQSREKTKNTGITVISASFSQDFFIIRLVIQLI